MFTVSSHSHENPRTRERVLSLLHDIAKRNGNDLTFDWGLAPSCITVHPVPSSSTAISRGKMMGYTTISLDSKTAVGCSVRVSGRASLYTIWIVLLSILFPFMAKNASIALLGGVVGAGVLSMFLLTQRRIVRRLATELQVSREGGGE